MEAAKVQKEFASALWSMANQNEENQVAIAKAGGIPPLIALLEATRRCTATWRGAVGARVERGQPEEHRRAGGIVPLVDLLKHGALGAQETAAGALSALAETPENRVTIASSGGISLLIALFDGGSEEAKEQAAAALQTSCCRTWPTSSRS